MKVLKLIFTIGCMILCIASFAFAQTATIVVEHWSPWENDLAGRTTPPSTGLTVVGNGELVYLLATADSAFTTVAWSIASQPSGSTTTLDSTDKTRTTFRPDVVGDYSVQLDVLGVTTSVVITAAEYVGVGTVGGATPVSFPDGQCGTCHAGNTATWMETGHSTMFELAIDGLKSSHYGEGCIDCHTVGYDTTAVNGGFDDVQADLGWVFPDTLKVGVWDDVVSNFSALAAKSNIQCENCHGPGSLHKGDVSKIDISLDEGTCGRCHEDGHYHRRNTMWKASGHGTGTSFARGTSTSCAPCHSGWGFIAKVDPASDLEQKTGNQNVSCAVCHDPHATKTPGAVGDAMDHQIRDQDEVTLGDGTVITKGGTGKLCMNCHIGRREAITYAQDPHRHFGPHHSNQADMLFGANTITWGMVVPSSTHKDALKNVCVDCHMFATPADGEPGRDKIGDHSWAMSVDVEGVEVQNVAACVRCHGDIEEYNDIVVTKDYDGDGTIEGYQDELDGQMEIVAMLLPPVDSPDVQDDPDDSYTRVQLNALFNYHYIHDDASHGAHNFRFAMGLMKLSEAALTYGVLTAGEITSINDVPNDQGKQVRVTWTRFGGDGISDNPVRYYSLWRKVDDMSTKAEDALPSLNINAEEVATLAVGTKLVIEEGELWDFVGSVPAATMKEYSTVVPTLYDAANGDTVMSTFVVSGHTNVTAIYAKTDEAYGYSVDNLAPSVPTSLAGLETENGIALDWDEAADEDFKYFAVYRSESSAVDPAGLEPIATVTENNFVDQNVLVSQSYYYSIAAFDFSGNRSNNSGTFTLTVTSVVESNGVIPEEYALEQNYPNPFNPATTIKFGLKESGNVELEVYNAVGEKVMTVIHDHMEAGTHNVTVQAGGLPSGVYFYKLYINNFTTVKKMVLIKQCHRWVQDQFFLHPLFFVLKKPGHYDLTSTFIVPHTLTFNLSETYVVLCKKRWGVHASLLKWLIF